jgi:hypothetical protein
MVFFSLYSYFLLSVSVFKFPRLIAIPIGFIFPLRPSRNGRFLNSFVLRLLLPPSFSCPRRVLNLPTPSSIVVLRRENRGKLAEAKKGK